MQDLNVNSIPPNSTEFEKKFRTDSAHDLHNLYDALRRSEAEPSHTLKLVRNFHEFKKRPYASVKDDFVISTRPISWYIHPTNMRHKKSAQIDMRSRMSFKEGIILPGAEHCIKSLYGRFNDAAGCMRIEDEVYTDDLVFSSHMFTHTETRKLLTKEKLRKIKHRLQKDLAISFATDSDRSVIVVNHNNALYEIEYVHPLQEDQKPTRISEALNIEPKTTQDIEKGIDEVSQMLIALAESLEIKLRPENLSKGTRAHTEWDAQGKPGTLIPLTNRTQVETLLTTPNGLR